MTRLDATRQLIKKVLKDDYLSPIVDEYTMTEKVSDGSPCFVTVKIRHEKKDGVEVIEGKGVGFIDALAHGLMNHFVQEFESLKTIQFIGFGVRARMDTSRDPTGADAIGVVSLTVRNSEGTLFEFEKSGRSLAAASLAVVTEAIEHFVNSERAFITCYRALVDARERGRSDLAQTYTAQLSQLVTTTSYTQIIERIKRDAL